MKEQPELTIVELPVDSLVPYANNAKKHPIQQVEQIAESVKEFGNCDPIAVWHNDAGEPEIVEGHGRLMALKQLGIDMAPVIYLDHLSDAQRRAYTHIHNQTTMNTGWDFETLDADIEELPFDFQDFGFFTTDDVDIDGFFGDQKEQKDKDPKKLTCPECGYEFEEQ